MADGTAARCHVGERYLTLRPRRHDPDPRRTPPWRRRDAGHRRLLEPLAQHGADLDHGRDGALLADRRDRGYGRYPSRASTTILPSLTSIQNDAIQIGNGAITIGGKSVVTS